MGKWRIEEVMPVIDAVASIIMEDPRFVSIAVTGSVARNEFPVNDIDLIVFHDGRLSDGSWSDPPKPTLDLHARNISPFAQGFVPSVRAARRDIPVDFLVVNQKALWDCEYLQSLKSIEQFADFYLRVFCDPALSLVLWKPLDTKALFHEAIMKNRSWWSYAPDFLVSSLSLCLRLKHVCDNPLCKPKQTWQEAKKEMMKRKARSTRWGSSW